MRAREREHTALLRGEEPVFMRQKRRAGAPNMRERVPHASSNACACASAVMRDLFMPVVQRRALRNATPNIHYAAFFFDADACRLRPTPSVDIVIIEH
jgi:hypothetical protein